MTCAVPALRSIASHGRAVLDDVERPVAAAVAEDDGVELVDRLVDPAVDAAVAVDDPDAAVVELGLVGLVAVGGHGIGDDGASGQHEGGVGRDGNLVPTNESQPVPPTVPLPRAMDPPERRR